MTQLKVSRREFMKGTVSVMASAVLHPMLPCSGALAGVCQIRASDVGESVVSLQTADGPDSNILLHERTDAPWTFYVNTSTLGLKHKMTMDDVQSIYAPRYRDFASHGHAHDDPIALLEEDPDLLWEHLVRPIEVFQAAGIHTGALHYGAPYGRVNEPVFQMALEAGYKTVRGDEEHIQYVPGWAVLSQSMEEREGLTVIQAALDECVNAPGTLLCLGVHRVVEVPHPRDRTTLAHIQTVIDMVSDAGLRMVTMSEAYQHGL